MYLSHLTNRGTGINEQEKEEKEEGKNPQGNNKMQNGKWSRPCH